MNKKSNSNFLSNWKVVILSLIGATTFWFIRTLNKDHSALISYPIEFVYTQDSVVVMEPLPEVVKVDVSSGGWNLFRRTLLVQVDPIRISMDNPTEIKYFTRSTLLPLVTESLSGLNVNYLITDTLNINIEKRVAKQVKIRVDSLNLPLLPRYRLVSDIQIDPPFVTILGPESIVSILEDEYYVMPRAKRIDEEVEETVAIPLPFEQWMQAEPSQVDVKFDVDRFDRLRVGIQMDLLNFPDDSTIYPAITDVNVAFTIQNRLKEDFVAMDFGVSADYNLMDQEDSTISPMIIYHPEHAMDVIVLPEKIDIIHEFAN
ncbi:MAG: hypothetical protein JXQ90_17745 [Cyclobacteriaceae bacterium]